MPTLPTSPVTAEPNRPPSGAAAALPEGFGVALDEGTSLWAGDRVATGGSPWKVVRMGAAAVPLLGELRAAGKRGVVFGSPLGRALARQLLDHGFARPVPPPVSGPHDVTVVVPAYGRPDELELTLKAVRGLPVVVVDDASPDPEPLRRLAETYGARLVRHAVNRGPAAARDTGLRTVSTAFTAFVDSDCRPEPGWLDALMPHFADPKVAVVAPRIVPDTVSGRLLARYEAARSALDMGERPALVRPGAKLGFVPSATLVVRNAALGAPAFDAALRLGEDVDFVWRTADLGWHVRYQPEARVVHTPRLDPKAWAKRRHEYGTSAPDLENRHPGRLVPARPSAWNLATLGLVTYRRPVSAAVSVAVTTYLLRRSLAGTSDDWKLSAAIVAKGVTADAAALGHALRREWWPLGLVCLAASPRSRLARAACAAMLTPIAYEWATRRPAVDPLRYTALRLMEDVSYGSGVTAAAWRARTLAPLLPRVRMPFPKRAKS
ncbi:mycofactocin biosynthesis glycosyltransferase MftF [Actinocorallia sp. A-T 12471]|uniref:mycofactocin biosynthesis glycosyltransferase MftF n=1 Tax=Actinocorallia sp. A-T 12471 TaxID=3089813 RepID=UPI0029CE2F09|nr:mycofactocin biosynthesis glycosyltransferase MftF [Actinocorallia sp. A-T 12471]MDX6742669.1 mycofactocin biosynthesis glycosyltransferase MftF [Actinocorallia sp. A-T 12471]